MVQFELPIYTPIRNFIDEKRNNNKSWEEIKYACMGNEEGLQTYINVQILSTTWPEIEIEDWYEFVRRQKESEEETIKMEEIRGFATILGDGQQNSVIINNAKNSSWSMYKQGLLDDNWDENTIKSIELSSKHILKNLNIDTRKCEPVKGLVIGNVQSGKTANMAALMAMAADNGWNFFIVLSGTIENLRKQTEDRLYGDLHHDGCRCNWIPLNHLGPKSCVGYRLQDCSLDSNSRNRYFCVCLKNATDLKNLIKWTCKDAKKRAQLKILVIDDEADQAGVNTANVDKNTRKAINKAICNLVGGNDESSKPAVPVQSMNYIAYTATPYANILNEAGRESLYPRNFITTLSVSKEYFGPQQIFGIDTARDINYDGLNIVRRVDDADAAIIKSIHDGSKSIPVSFENSLCWFLCGAACFKYWNIAKPVSMLVHTSQKTDHHFNVVEAIKTWFKQDKSQIVDKCKYIWEFETNSFTKKDFNEQYHDYSQKSRVRDYPSFNDIKDGICELLNKITHINLDEDGALSYHKGIHLCIDNCKGQKKMGNDDIFVRLAYPNKDNNPGHTTAFIVVGGATLSRGLTIEGLISTYFLRSCNQADSLMQMGRWFGYRKYGHELIPRLWITDKTQKQFVFLAQLDQELRDEIYDMQVVGKSPLKYAPKVKNSPKLSFIRIAAKNKMQKAVTADVDYRGEFKQTYLFDNSNEVLQHNLTVTTDFIDSLQQPIEHKEVNAHAKNVEVWKDVSFDRLESFLKEFKFQSRLSVLNDIDPLISWIKEVTAKGLLANWNVLLAGKETSDGLKWNSQYCSIGKIIRTKKIDSKHPDLINIGTLRTMTDFLADVDLEDVKDDNLKAAILKATSKNVPTLRMKAGLTNVPQLVVYIIDKKSAVKKSKDPDKHPTREGLDLSYDIVGLCINIPSTDSDLQSSNFIKSLHIDLPDENDFSDESDVEGEED